MPRSKRDLDLGFVLHAQPTHLNFDSFTTSTLYMHPVVGPGEFRLTYVVISENFPPARVTVDVTLGTTLEQVVIGKV